MLKKLEYPTIKKFANIENTVVHIPKKLMKIK